MEFNKDRGSSKNKLAAEQTWNDALWKQVFNQRSQSPPGQDDAGIELSALNKIQNLGQQTSNAAVGVSEIPTLSRTGDPEQHGKSIGRSQRREKHNRMEMERRHRLNMYIDELRLYVPFCNIATDKATTLKWTVSFVKYIQEQHGDSLKKAFESAHNRTAEMMMEGNQCKCCSANPRHHLHAGCHVTPW
ncbi:transcription factor-like 5 protein [Pyxicephalus adspersus]